MLRMSKLADYAFVILVQMMASPQESWSASALAEATKLPLPTVAKLMKFLARGAIVAAFRGATGGYKLSPEAGQFSVVDVIEAVDGPIGLTECTGSEENKRKNCACAVGPKDCPVKESWDRVNKAIKSALETVKLAEFCPHGKIG